MAEVNSASLHGLHQDLVTLTESRSPIDYRLCLNLEAHIEAFKKLLDKPPRSEASRKSLSSGTIQLGDETYSVNAEFQDETMQLADTLDLDELEAARWLLNGQDEAEILDRSPIAAAIIQFHTDRSFLLECLRLLLKGSFDTDCDEEIRSFLVGVVKGVVEMKGTQANRGSVYAQKCITAMENCENSLQALSERIQRTLTLGQTSTVDFDEIMDFQQKSLNQQHESLAAIVTYLIKGSHTGTEAFLGTLVHVSKLDKWNSVTVHYVPVLLTFASEYGSPEGNGNRSNARSINKKILDDFESKPWSLGHLHAAMVTWWLAEYSGWYFDQPIGSPLGDVDLEAEAQARSEVFSQALSSGAFQCTLSISSQIRQNDWYDPAKTALTQSLLENAPVLSGDGGSMTTYFQDLIMEQFENFTNAFITNMPDNLRRFKIEEDDQRRHILSGIQTNEQNGLSGQDRHLERFLVIMSYAYNERPDAAQSFWTDAESNLYGFLQWVSRRQSTPCVGAFCEMFRSISPDDESASAAHRFLLEEGSIAPGRLRRSISMSWNQVFEELDFYSSKVREQPLAPVPMPYHDGKQRPVEIDEPESPMMLECYLRLTAHLCSKSALIRSWILAHPTFHIVDTLFLLCSSSVPARIRACAYTTLRSLLVEKNAELSNLVWTALDQWVSAGFSSGFAVSRLAKGMNPPALTEELTFETISNSFEEANAFVHMLHALVMPSIENADLKDALPFPEQLGSSYRTTGVEPYVDLVLGKIFTTLIPQLDDQLQSRILGYNCLLFTTTCLVSFNEDLLILANKSTLPIEDCLHTSSLAAYIRLHPFTRAIEWMFNERVLATLFSLAHQDIEEINRSQPDSPLVLALLQCIGVMNLIMNLQSTYLDIVRPLMKMETSARRQPVLNPSLSLFEDAISSNLRIIIDLGFYCGSGHQDLVLASLKLLEKFSASRKLNAPQTSKLGSRLTGNRMIGIIQQENNSEPIARSLISAMDFDDREISRGIASSGYHIKLAILEFLERTLMASPDRPSLAHLFLGFDCIGDTVNVADDGLFAYGSSLFHAVIRIVIEYPDGSDDSMLSWFLDLKQKALRILKILWTSSLTSIYSLVDMRSKDVLFFQWTRQIIMDQDVQWDEISIRDPHFIFQDSALALIRYLEQRKIMFDYASMEFRLVTTDEIKSLKVRITSTLLGSTATEDGEIVNPTLFDLLDFLELDFHIPSLKFDSQYLADIDFSIGTELSPDGSLARYDLRTIEELLALRRNAFEKVGRLQEQFSEEANDAMLYFRADNNRRQIETARMAVLKGWVDLATLVIESSHFSNIEKTTLILQAIQLITPKFELYASDARPEALVFANFSQVLVSNLDFEPSAIGTGRANDVASDRLFQLFRISLRSIQNPGSDIAIREVLYNICYRYLTSIIGVATVSTYRPHNLQLVRAAGDGLIDIICDDAYTGEGPCRVAALLLLNALTKLSLDGDSKYIVESLVRSNFIIVLVETINDVPREFLGTNEEDIPWLLAYQNSKLSLLLTMTQSRLGAAHVLNAGIFLAVRGSGLFNLDPDIGLEIDNPKALQRYYELLLSILRIVTGIVLSRGAQNQSTIQQARTFLTETRPAMVTIFKRQANIGGQRIHDGVMAKCLDELVEFYVLLISLTGFMEYEEKKDTQKPHRIGFS